MIETLVPTAEMLAAHQRMAALPRISRSIKLEGDDAGQDAVRIAKLALKGSYQRLYNLQKLAAASGRTDAALLAAIDAAKAEITRRKHA